jgi:hypothetical protein
VSESGSDALDVKATIVPDTGTWYVTARTFNGM